MSATQESRGSWIGIVFWMLVGVGYGIVLGAELQGACP